MIGTRRWERHQLTPEQVEEVCYGSPENILVEETHSSRLRVIGPKNNGKLLVIILAQEGPNTYYVVTAKPPKRQELRRYQDWKGDAKP
jgi:uncharacterized DUF497 family protein